MYLDYSKIVADTDGTPIIPSLRLQRLSGETLGTLHGVHDLKFNINYSELSEISFTIPYMDNGLINSLYSKVEGYTVVWTKNYGVYLLTTPQTTGSGLEEKKTVKGYSIEKLFERKKFFLAEGTYNFYDPFNPDDTILGRILELDDDWEIGHVDVSLVGRYRTFTQYDNNALSFIYGDMIIKFRCVVVFDPYFNPTTGKRRIHIYDADADITTLPIYLSYDNLVSETNVTELSDELITKLNVYGADNLSIREVNPIGSDYIVNLDHFINRGDIPQDLATKVHSWQSQIIANQEYYTGIVSLRASATAKKIAMQAELTDLEGELDNLVSQQNITIQTLATETTDEGKETQQKLLDKINADISAKKSEIEAKKQEIEDETESIENYAKDIVRVNDNISYVNFFSEEDRRILSRFLIEDTVTESSFVASSVDTKVSGETSSITGAVQISESDISEINMTELYGKKMYTITGGKLVIQVASLSAYIIRGTLEIKNGTNEYVCSIYLGTCVYGDTTHPSGLFTISGTLSGFSSDISLKDDNGLQLMQGTTMSFNANNANAFISANVSDYQKYSVSQELYEFGQEILAEKAFPTYEFTMDAANFLFQENFSAFKDRLEFGKGIYLMLGSMGRVVATFIGAELDFGDASSIGLTFANRFQKHDGRSYLKQLLDKTYSSSRSLDVSKYIYNQAAAKTTQVSEFMNESIKAAVNRIIGASNESVIIDGGGIHVGTGDYQIRIVDNMIAITDDAWQTAKVAIGMFSSEALGTYFGVNADVLAGKLLVGNYLIIECANDDGVMQFKVDSSGAWINNGTLVLQKDNGGKILIDPRYGILAGNSGLFTTNGTTVSPSFVNASGNVEFDTDGMPKNSNFYLDVNTGAAYFRGKLNATSGSIGGFTIEDDYLHAGSGGNYVALNGSGSNSNSAYAMWAGASSPTSAKFYVKKDGTVSVKGVLDADELKIKGTNVLAGDQISGKYINPKGIGVTNSSGQTTFKVDENGNVTINGNITMTGGSISWGNINESGSSAYQLANQANTTANSAQSTADSAQSAADTAYSYAESARSLVSGWQYGGTTYIDGSKLYTGTVRASSLEGGYIALLDSYGDTVGSISLGNAYYSDYAVDLESSSALRLRGNGIVYISNDRYDTGYIQISNIIGCGGIVAPTYAYSDLTLGYSGCEWSAVYARTSTIITSDKKEKKDIVDLPDKYIDMVSDLRPRRFKLIDGESGRDHIGFIAQEVEEAMTKHSIDSMEFGGFIKDSETGNYMLRYEEFIAILAAKIKKMDTEYRSEIESLKAEISQYKEQKEKA